jgi:MFS family permease
MEQNKIMKNSSLRDFGRWRYLAFGMVIMLCLGTVYSYSVFRLSIEKKFGIGSVQSGMPYMMALSSYAFFMFLTGKYIDKYNPKTILMIGGSLVSTGWILSAFSPNIYMLTITYGLISGAGVGIAYGIPMTAAAKWFPENKGLAVGLVLVGFGMSPLITAPMARFLVEQLGLMRAFLVLGISFGIVILILSSFFKYPDVNFKYTKELDKNNIRYLNSINTKAMIRTHSFKGLYVNFVIGTMIGLTVIGLTNNIGIEFIGLTADKTTILFPVFAIFNGVGRPIFGWITDRLSAKKAMFISYILIVISALLLLFIGRGNSVVYAVSFSVLWFNLGGWLAIAPTSTLAFYGKEHYSQNYGVVFTAYGIGAVSGVITSGILMDFYGDYKYLFGYIVLLSLVGIAFTVRFIRD